MTSPLSTPVPVMSEDPSPPNPSPSTPSHKRTRVGDIPNVLIEAHKAHEAMEATMKGAFLDATQVSPDETLVRFDNVPLNALFLQYLMQAVSLFPQVNMLEINNTRRDLPVTFENSDLYISQALKPMSELRMRGIRLDKVLLGNLTAEELRVYVQHSDTLHSLVLRDNGIGKHQSRLFLWAAANSRAMKTLEFVNNNVNNAMIEDLVASLGKNLPKQTSVQRIFSYHRDATTRGLSSVTLSCEDALSETCVSAAFEHFMRGYMSRFSIRVKLYSDVRCVHLVYMKPHIPEEEIIMLSLSFCWVRLTDNLFSQILRALVNPRLYVRQLNLSNVGLTDAHVQRICDAASTKRIILYRLDLSYNRLLTSASVVALLKVLERHRLRVHHLLIDIKTLDASLAQRLARVVSRVTEVTGDSRCDFYTET